MRSKLLYLLLAAVPVTISAAETVKSPNGNVMVAFELSSDGTPMYRMTYRNKIVVDNSMMGFELKDAPSLERGFRQQSVDWGSFDETWVPVWGENDSIVNRYNYMTVALTQKADGSVRKMNIEFRVYDDGMGFRYIFPRQSTKTFIIDGECTEMAMTGDHTAWWIPGDYDSQEFDYIQSRLSEIGAINDIPNNANPVSSTAVQTALMLKTDDNIYLNLHEAALVDFPAMHLELCDSTLVFKSALTPSADGTMAVINTPFSTPWRTVTVSDKATDILASNLILNLNEPCVLDDTSWIHPVKYMGVWWEMITGKNSWSYTNADNVDLATFDYSKAKPHGMHSANNDNVRRYIDFAAEHGFDQLLIEGWNIGWEDWFGKEKDFVFDFMTPYPDFDIAALNEYAHSKGIKLMMHHETSGSIPNYEKHIDSAYDLMNKYGYDAVKSGYVGNILPKGEHHYGQKEVRHYLDAVKKAAVKKIMVNAHEAVRPTGLCRTYPNLVGNESAMGTEYIEMLPAHGTILPFTRLKGGPMDFTPGVFRMDLSTFAPGVYRKKRATIANQLALYCTMYSPLQMAADMPEHYMEKADAFRFIKDVPVDWSKSIYLDAEPGDFIVVARKDKNSDNWYVGGVTDENARDYTLRYNFLTPGKEYEATIYADAADTDCDTNPETYVISTQKISSDSWTTLRMARGGGFAISVKEL